MKAAIKKALDELKLQNGKLMPQIVIDAARPKESVLHGEFTWDAKDALRKNLQREAGELIQAYKVTIIVGDRSVKCRNFVSLSSDRISGGGYRQINSVLDDEMLRQVLIADALGELETFRLKYHRLNELAGLFAEIDKIQQHDEQKAA